MQSTLTAHLVTDALVMAVWRRGMPPTELAHSDHGSQYPSESVQRVLTAQGIACSMRRSGNVWDNAVMERICSTLNIERTARHDYGTRDAVRADVFDDIEQFYNPIQRHSTPGSVSPMAFEQEVA